MFKFILTKKNQRVWVAMSIRSKKARREAAMHVTCDKEVTNSRYIINIVNETISRWKRVEWTLPISKEKEKPELGVVKLQTPVDSYKHSKIN